MSIYLMVCVSSRVTEVEKRAVREAAVQAGGKAVYLMEEPIAAATTQIGRASCRERV